MAKAIALRIGQHICQRLRSHTDNSDRADWDSQDLRKEEMICWKRGSTWDSGADGQRGRDQTDRNRSGKEREERKSATKRVRQKPREVIGPSGLVVRTIKPNAENPPTQTHTEILRWSG